MIWNSKYLGLEKNSIGKLCHVDPISPIIKFKIKKIKIELIMKLHNHMIVIKEITLKIFK